MRKILRTLKVWMKVLGETLVSFLRVIFYASLSTSRRIKRIKKLSNVLDRRCVILGNGPSLKEAITNNELDDGDFFAVNMFVKSEDFWSLKPIAYFLIDPYLSTNEISELSAAFSKVHWSMMLVVPQMMKEEIYKKLLDNPNINLVRVNSNEFIGFKSIRHWFYMHNLAMVPCQTVVNAALMFAISMGYKHISLYGADHTWTRDLIVNDNNEVCYGDRHVYKTKVEYIKMNHNMGAQLEYFSQMFKSHYLIREYANRMNVKILNKTKGSFIDAYERN